MFAAVLVALPAAGAWQPGTAHAATVAGETFTGISTSANQWVSGGGTEKACLTAASSPAANSIPSCTGGAIDSPGNGVLRLTRNSNNQSGFVIYNTPVSASQGLDIQFDMYQYGGSGADGIAFFLIDGAASPTLPGALGGALGYSSSDNGENPGIDGGYVGVGFDRWGNFSDPNFGTGGPGRYPNNITVRGSESSGYQYVSRKAASGQLGVESGGTRSNSKRHVRVTVSTNNIMTVSVKYSDAGSMVTELSNLDLNTINGPGSLPSSFKFGFAASTGGSNNNHEIGGMTVNTLNPNVSVAAQTGSGLPGEQSSYPIVVSNDPGAESTSGAITVTDTLPSDLKPLKAEGDGWDCSIVGQVITCERPGDGADALAPGDDAPEIEVTVQVSENSVDGVNYAHDLTVTTENNDDPDAESTAAFNIVGPGDVDGHKIAVEDAAPNTGDANNDGEADSEQTSVTSFVNPVTGKYSSLESGGDCERNSGVSVKPVSANTKADAGYSYPAGMMNFTITCDAPGSSTTVTQYYYGDYDTSRMVLRKYDPATQAYATISDAVVAKTIIGGQPVIRATYQVTDGGTLDQDGVVNGVIVDPAGLAIRAADITAPVSAPDTGLPQQSLVTYYCAALAGIVMLIYGIYIVRRQSA